jgi:hypothetical protein
VQTSPTPVLYCTRFARKLIICQLLPIVKELAEDEPPNAECGTGNAKRIRELRDLGIGALRYLTLNLEL